MRGFPRLLLPGLGLWLALGVLTSSVVAQIRIETEVFTGTSREPYSRNLTLLDKGFIYDFLLEEPAEIGVFDPGRKHFMLLDPSRQVRTSISINVLLEFTSQLKMRATRAAPEGSTVRFAAEPRFQVEYVDAKPLATLRLASDVLTYEVRASHAEGDSLEPIYEFFNRFALLNATNRGALPPQARLKLNQELAKRNLVPEEVSLTIAGRGRNAPAAVIRARHRIEWTLTDADRKRIETARQYIGQFDAVDLPKYRHVGEEVARQPKD